MKRHLLCLLLLIMGWQIKAQKLDLPNYDSTTIKYVESYFSVASGHSVIYTGKEESKYLSQMKNHPYLYTSEYKSGSLSFEGVFYPNVKLRLNEHKDELIILSPDGRFNIVLPTDKVDFATIENYFIYYNVPQKGIEALSEGYYVRLHNGTYPVWKRETCFIQSNIKDMKTELSFVRKNKLFILKDGKYNTIGNKRSILKLFKSKKKELKQFIKENELDFKQSFDASVVAVTEYYEILNR